MTSESVPFLQAFRVSRVPEEALQDAQELQRIFGGNVRGARMRLGLTQEDVAARCGSARSYVGAVEAGRQNLTLESLAAFARAVKSTVPQLLQLPEQTVDSSETILTSGVAPTKPGTLAIELPAGQAFELALAASERLGRPVLLIEPTTREIKGTAKK